MACRLLPALSVCVLGVAIAACGGGSGGGGGTVIAAPSPSPSAAAGTTYVAFGDDATVAIGSAVCGTALPSSACPTSASKAGTPLTVNGAAVNGYAQAFAQHLNVLHPGQSFLPAILGVTDALVGSVPVAASPPANDLVDNSAQIPALPGIASGAAGRNDRLAISLFSGINDVADAYYTQQCGSGTLTGVDGTMAAPCGAHGTTLPASTTSPRTGSLYTAYRSAFTSLKNAAPSALLVIGIPDLSKFPAFAAVSAGQLAQLNSDTQLANAALKAAADDSGIKYAYADLYGAGIVQPSLYTGAFAGDGYHFSETGYSRIEGLAEQAFTATFPSF